MLEQKQGHFWILHRILNKDPSLIFKFYYYFFDFGRFSNSIILISRNSYLFTLNFNLQKNIDRNVKL